jgi:protein O-mannosyl-transferase
MSSEVSRIDSGSQPPGSAQDVRLAAFLLVLLVLLVYTQTLDFGFITYDDSFYILENPHMRQGVTAASLKWALSDNLAKPSLTSEYWIPVTNVSRLMDVSLFGFDPAGPHFVNLAFHAANVLLFFALLVALTGATAPAAFAAALFAVHPLHAESVAWIIERKDVLSQFFALLSLHAYIRFRKDHALRLCAATLAFFVLSILSKPMTVTLPVLMFLLNYWPIPEGRRLTGPGIPRRILLPLLPLFALSLIDGIVTLRSYTTFPLWSSSGWIHVTNAFSSLVVYLERLVIPFRYACYYPYPAQPPSWLRLAASLAVLGGIAVWSWRKRRSHPHRIVGFLWYLTSISLMIGNVFMANANRFTYLPMLGVYMGIAWEVHAFVRGDWTPRVRAACAVVVLALAACGFHETSYWQDSVTLFRRNLEIVGSDVVSHRNLALALAAHGDFAAAHGELDKAHRRNPVDVTIHHVRGVILTRQNLFDQASSAYAAGLAIDPANIKLLENLCNLRAAMGDSEGAWILYERRMRLTPEP